jgi:hypothetical protein
MTAVARRLYDFWFAPAGPGNLGWCRLLFFGLMFWHYVEEPFAPWADVPRAFWRPEFLFEKFRLPVLPHDALLATEIAWKAALLLSAIGLLTRVSTAAAFALGLYLLGLRHNWGKLGHDDALLVWVMGILTFARCGDAWSLDAWVRRRRHIARGDAPLAPEALCSGEYTWPVRAVWLTVALVFFNSAVAKLDRSGVAWALSDNLAVLLVHRHYGGNPSSDLGLHLAQVGWLCRAMAAGALLVELLFPLVLVHRAFRWTLVPAAFLMQQGNTYLLGVDFTHFTFAYLFFINWPWLADRARALAGRPSGAAEAPATFSPAP